MKITKTYAELIARHVRLETTTRNLLRRGLRGDSAVLKRILREIKENNKNIAEINDAEAEAEWS